MMAMSAKRKNRSETQDGAAGQAAANGASRFSVVPEAETHMVAEQASSAGVVLFSAVVFAVAFAAVAGLWHVFSGSVSVLGFVVALAIAGLLTMSVHIAQQWEKVVVLRFGEFNRVSGPGLFWTIPIIEQNTMRVDGRVRVTTFGAEETLTADLVPPQCQRGVVLDGLGCEIGMHRGGKFYPCG